jgi:WD40 repeat protein
MTKFWCTKTWQMQGEPIICDAWVFCIRYSPSGELLAIATSQNIHIYNSGTRKRVASFKGHTKWNWSLAWTLDGTRLLSGGDNEDPTIREWDPLTWQQVGHPWGGHTEIINAIAIDPTGTLVASASYDNHVRLWRCRDSRLAEHASLNSPNFKAQTRSCAFPSHCLIERGVPARAFPTPYARALSRAFITLSSSSIHP